MIPCLGSAPESDILYSLSDARIAAKNILQNWIYSLSAIPDSIPIAVVNKTHDTSIF